MSSYFIGQAANMKILDPQINPNLNWQEIRNELKEDRKRGFGGEAGYEFSKNAMAMKVLAAEKVEITDKGLEITM